MKLQNGFIKKKLMIGGNVIKITPQTYIDMNEEFEEKGDRIRIEVPTQEQIDEWREKSDQQSLQ